MSNAKPLFVVPVHDWETQKLLCEVEITEKDTVFDVKKKITKACKLIIFTKGGSHFYPEKQRLVLHNQNLKNNFLEILDYGLKPSSKLFVKNKGIQISYIISKILINIGPILIWTQLFNNPMLFYSLLHDKVEIQEFSRPQKLGYWMILFHFFKILFETVAIHRFNKQTMPLMKLIYEMSYTWVLLGMGGGYFLFNPGFQEPFWFRKLGFLDVSVDVLIYLFFLAFELMDFLCHWHLRGLRKSDHDRTYYNPFEYGFGYVTSANYFWQFIAFLVIVLTTQVLYIALFHAIMFVRLNKKAQKRHSHYVKVFSGIYEEKRTAFIPFLF